MQLLMTTMVVSRGLLWKSRDKASRHQATMTIRKTMTMTMTMNMTMELMVKVFIAKEITIEGTMVMVIIAMEITIEGTMTMTMNITVHMVIMHGVNESKEFYRCSTFLHDC